MLNWFRKKQTDQRDIHHWLYFATTDAREAFQKQATAKGYAVVNVMTPIEDESEAFPFGIHLSRMDDVNQLDKHREELTILAAEHQGDYDGYEIPI